MEKTDRELLIEANSIIRSFYSIASRDGKTTNWEAVKNKTKKILTEQHEVLYPTPQQIRKKKLKKLNENTK